jgi:hypothetical protein
MSSGTLYRVALVTAVTSENISRQSSGFLRVVGLHSRYCGVTVAQYSSMERLINGNTTEGSHHTHTHTHSVAFSLQANYTD